MQGFLVVIALLFGGAGMLSLVTRSKERAKQMDNDAIVMVVIAVLALLVALALPE